MIAALLKVVAIALTTVMLVTGIVFMTRINAFRQGAQAPPHAWFDRPNWLISPCPEPLAQPADGSFVLIPVRKVPARWEVTCGDRPRDLTEALGKARFTDVLFEVEAGVPEDLDKFVDIVGNAKIKNVGVHAASQRAARHLRKVAPHWVFAADDPSVLRLHMFASLFLEPAIEFWPDFVLADAGDKNALTEREATELHRRLKRIIWADRTREPSVAIDGRVN